MMTTEEWNDKPKRCGQPRKGQEMSENITPEAVAKMLEGVTPGPWVVEIDKRTWGWVDVIGPSINVGAPTRATDLCLADEITRKADARFIAWAREAVPALAAERDALAARVRELEVALQNITQQAAKDARDVFSGYKTAREAVDYMEQLIYAALTRKEQKNE